MGASQALMALGVLRAGGVRGRIVEALICSESFPYFSGGVGALAKQLGASRLTVRRRLKELRCLGLLIFKDSRRGRGKHALIRIKLRKDENGNPLIPPIGNISKEKVKLDPLAYTWKGRCMKVFRLYIRHPILVKVIGWMVFYGGLTREEALILYESYLASVRWLFSLKFHSVGQAYGFFRWLSRWILKRWWETYRKFSAQEVWEYAVA